jgi:membrane protein DedA with SNARE-associated domain
MIVFLIGFHPVSNVLGDAGRAPASVAPDAAAPVNVKRPSRAHLRATLAPARPILRLSIGIAIPRDAAEENERMRISHLPVLLFCLAAATTGCGIVNGTGRSLGQGVLGGVQQYATRQPTSDSLRAMFDSVGAWTGSAIANRIQPAIDTTLRRALERTEATMDRTEAMINRLQDTTLARFGGTFSTTLDELIRTNARTLGEEGRGQVSAMLRELRTGFETELAPMLNRTVAGVVDTLTARLAVNLEGDMLRALARAADSIAATGARAAVRAGDEGVQQSSLVRNIKQWAPFVIIGVLAISLGWYWYTRRRTEKALEAVATAIRDAGDPEIKSDVKTEALRRNVEPWLNEFLKRKGYLPSAG